METLSKDSVEKPVDLIEQESPETSEIAIDQQKVESYFESLKLEQNLLLGSVSGIAAMFIGAVIWAAITIVTNFQIGWMAVALGFIVGYALRLAGKGIDKVFGIIGASLALLGCILGNFLTLVGFIAAEESLKFFETLVLLDYSQVPGLMLQTSSPVDLLFYGIAVYEGYRFSFRKITEEELIAHTTK